MIAGRWIEGERTAASPQQPLHEAHIDGSSPSSLTVTMNQQRCGTQIGHA